MRGPKFDPSLAGRPVDKLQKKICARTSSEQGWVLILGQIQQCTFIKMQSSCERDEIIKI